MTRFRWRYGVVKKRPDFGGDPDHHLDTGIVFRIRHYWDIRKVVNGHLHLVILIRQMVGLIWNAGKTRLVGGICTVPMLLVTIII